MKQLFTNNAESTVANNPLAAGGTTLNVASGHGARFPAITGTDFFYLTLYDLEKTKMEVVKVTARSTDALTILRNQEECKGFTDQAYEFSLGDKIELRLTASKLSELESSLDYQDIESGFNHAYGTGSADLVYSSGVLTTITIYNSTSSHITATKLYTKTLTYHSGANSGNYQDGDLTTITTVDAKNGKTLTTTLDYDGQGGNLDSVNKVITDT